MKTITTTIKREYFLEIVARRKRVEYREIKPYWIARFAAVRTPFKLRLINGMRASAPEVTVLVRRIRRNRRKGQFELDIGSILEVKNWHRGRQQAARRA